MEDALKPEKRRKESAPHYGNAMKLGRKAKKEADAVIQEIEALELSDLQKKNIKELANALGISESEIKPMNYLEADSGKTNPSGNDYNCQSVVVAFEARRRRLNCIAPEYNSDNDAMFELGEFFQNAFLSPKTLKPIQPTLFKGESDNLIIKKLEKQLSVPGRYVLGTNKKSGEGHLYTIDVLNNKTIVIHDEQDNSYINLNTLSDIDYLELIKIDKALLNVNLLSKIFLKF